MTLCVQKKPNCENGKREFEERWIEKICVEEEEDSEEIACEEEEIDCEEIDCAEIDSCQEEKNDWQEETH